MKAVLNETKRILAVMLSVAMIIAAVPQAAFAAPSDNSAEEPEIQIDEVAPESATEEASEPQTEPVQEPVEGDSEEEIVQKDAGNEVAEEDVVTDEEKDAVRRVLTVTPDATTDLAGNAINVGYGDAVVGDWKVTSTEFTDNHTAFTYEILGATDYKKIGDIDSYIAKNTEADLNSAYALLGAKALPEGLEHEKDGAIIEISGITTQAVQAEGKDKNVWYLVVKDTAGASAGDTYNTALMKIVKFTITINDAGDSFSSAIPNRFATNTVTFGRDTTDTATTPDGDAKAGYTVSKISETGATSENVHPITLTLTETNIDPAFGDKVTATITEFSSEANDASLVQSGTDASTSFTVAEGTNKGTGQTVTTEKNLGSGQNGRSYCKDCSRDNIYGKTEINKQNVH